LLSRANSAALWRCAAEANCFSAAEAARSAGRCAYARRQPLVGRTSPLCLLPLQKQKLALNLNTGSDVRAVNDGWIRMYTSDRGPGPMYIYVTSATLPAVRPQPPFFPPVGEADSMFDSGQGAGQTAVHAGRVGRAGQGRAMGWARTQLKSRGGATAAAVACGRPDRRVRKESQA
jgi:hypothetical protein